MAGAAGRTGGRSGRPASRPPASPAPVAVQHLRVRYAKRGRMRFASHRDIARAVERGVRKGGLPIAYSAGFSPHPKISYAGAAATGVASEAEYLELALTSACAPEDVRDRLSAALPDGIDVIEVMERGSEQGFADLEVSQWQVTLPGVTRAAAEAAVGAFLAASEVEVERLTSKGLRRMNARAAVISMELGRRAAATRPGEWEMLRMVVRHATPAVRPDDILAALQRVAHDSVAHDSVAEDSALRENNAAADTSAAPGTGAAGLGLSAPPLITRLAQGPLRGGSACSAAPGRLRQRPAVPIRGDDPPEPPAGGWPPGVPIRGDGPLESSEGGWPPGVPIRGDGPLESSEGGWPPAAPVRGDGPEEPHGGGRPPEADRQEQATRPDAAAATRMVPPR